MIKKLIFLSVNNITLYIDLIRQLITMLSQYNLDRMNNLFIRVIPKANEVEGVPCDSAEAMKQLKIVFPSVGVITDIMQIHKIAKTTYKDTRDGCLLFRNALNDTFISTGDKGTHVKFINSETFVDSSNYIHVIMVKCGSYIVVYTDDYTHCKIYYEGKIFAESINGMIIKLNPKIYDSVIVDNTFITMNRNNCASIRFGAMYGESLSLAKQAMRIHNALRIFYTFCQNPDNQELISPVFSNKPIVERNAEIECKEGRSEEKDNATQCKICYNQIQRKIAFIPCGHAATCGECAKKCATCPICRERIKSTLIIYEC